MNEGSARIFNHYDIRQRALRKGNFVVMGFVMKVLWQDHTFVMKCTLNALCLLAIYNTSIPIVCQWLWAVISYWACYQLESIDISATPTCPENETRNSGT